MDRRTAQMFRAAQLYYEQDLNQGAIAETMGVSRASVSRLLSDARGAGMVRISIEQPVPLRSDLSEQLRTRFDLRDAIVVMSGDDDVTSMKRVGESAADFLVSIVNPDSVVAISWGRTLFHMVNAISPQGYDGVEVVQMLGSLGEGDPNIDGPELARLCASRLGGSYRYVHAPAVVKSAELCLELAEQPQVYETLRRAGEAEIAISSVGSLDDASSSLERNGYLTDQERLDYSERGAVGHVLAKLIGLEGQEFEPFNSRVVAIPLEQLSTRPWSICLATGASKAAALHGAIHAGHVNTIVIDESTANALLELART